MRFTEFESRVDLVIEDEIAEAQRRTMALRTVRRVEDSELFCMWIRVTVRTRTPRRVSPRNGPAPIGRDSMQSPVVTRRAREFRMLTVEFEARPRCVIELPRERAKRSLVMTTRTRTSSIDAGREFRVVERTPMRIGVTRDARATRIGNVTKGLAAPAEGAAGLVGTVRTRVTGLATLLGMSALQCESRPSFVIERIACAGPEAVRAVALRTRAGVLVENRRIDLREEARMRIGMTVIASAIRLVEAPNPVLSDSVTRLALRLRVHARQSELRRGMTCRIERVRCECMSQVTRPTIRGVASIGELPSMRIVVTRLTRVLGPPRMTKRVARELGVVTLVARNGHVWTIENESAGCVLFTRHDEALVAKTRVFGLVTEHATARDACGAAATQLGVADQEWFTVR